MITKNILILVNRILQVGSVGIVLLCHKKFVFFCCKLVPVGKLQNERFESYDFPTCIKIALQL